MGSAKLEIPRRNGTVGGGARLILLEPAQQIAVQSGREAMAGGLLKLETVGAVRTSTKWG